jgi:hypothetical protein
VAEDLRGPRVEGRRGEALFFIVKLLSNC